ncbi:interleukin-23 subunit alpha-like [Sceloporus undulatus]|uniref:interleukin-23 subunit alpha-like n=1 Tax=Sceloporus undulatus TaxID=8520 RepID=UPI001C4B4F55|nr:interleukin-23 subunit alpha-like [Sceloporus undulatus]
MMHNLRNHLGRCLLGLLLLFVASRGMTLPRETNNVWQHGKDASYEILRQLEKLDIREPEVFNTTIQFPQPIECSDSCDPDSLTTTNKMHCLTKISKGLHDYHNLLVMFDDSEVMMTTELQKVLNSLLQLPLLKMRHYFRIYHVKIGVGLGVFLTQMLYLLQDGSNKESRSPVTKTSGPAWQKGPLQNLTLWRLQSFAVVVARVFSHCASLF